MKKRGPVRSVNVALFMLPLIILMAGASFSSPEKSDQEAQKEELIQRFRTIFDLGDISDTQRLSKILDVKMEIDEGEKFDTFNKRDSNAIISWIEYYSNHNNRHRTMQSAFIKLHINKDLACIRVSDIEGEFGKKYTHSYGVITDMGMTDGLRYEEKENGHIHLTPEFQWFQFISMTCLDNFSVYQVVRPQ